MQAQVPLLPRAGPHTGSPKSLSGLWYRLNQSLAGERDRERLKAKCFGFVRLGKGLSLPEALPAVFDLGQ